MNAIIISLAICAKCAMITGSWILPFNVFKLQASSVKLIIVPLVPRLVFAQLAQMASICPMVHVLSMNAIFKTVFTAMTTLLVAAVLPITFYSTIHVFGKLMPAMLKTVLLVHMPQKTVLSVSQGTCLGLPTPWAAKTMLGHLVFPILSPWSPIAKFWVKSFSGPVPFRLAA